MGDKQFQVIMKELEKLNSKLDNVIEIQNDHTLKLNSITEQTADNTEMKVELEATTELTKKAIFEIELIKKFIRN